MQNTLTIAGRQFRSYFNGPIAYIVVCFFLLLLGYFFFFNPPGFFIMNQASARTMFSYFGTINYFALPALTMGLLADEKGSGTIELLITMPVRDAEVILGKFLGVLALYCVLIVLTLPYPISVSTLGDLDWGPVFAGYVGLFLQGCALLGIGLMCSSFTNSQVVALFAAWGFSLFFFLADKAVAWQASAIVDLVEFISFDFHLTDMRRGVIALRDVVFFGSIAAFSLLVSFRALESRRWS